MPEDTAGGGVQFPTDFASLGVEGLTALESALVAEFDALDIDGVDASGAKRMFALADEIGLVRAELSGRPAEPVDMTALRDRVHVAAVEPAVTAAVTSTRGRTDVRDVLRSGGTGLNARLSDVRDHQPSTVTPKLTEPFGRSILIASADVPGYTLGGEISDMTDLVHAYRQRARAMPVTRALAGGKPIYQRNRKGDLELVGHRGSWQSAPRAPVASMQRDFRFKLGPDALPAEVDEVLRASRDPQALLASGGWCSPSEIRYDFYNIAGVDGMLDLPTVGINRGGLRWPVSPSFCDALLDTSCIWHWTETQDIAAATGTGQSGTKTCCHVECASMNEARLACDGICVTAGNLATDAWPEMVANGLNLINSMHVHDMNARKVASLVASSIAVSPCASGMGLTIPLLDAIELQAIDSRNRYAMNDWDILEVVLPSWIIGGIRSDLSKRVFGTPDAAFNVTNAMIATWFDTRYIRVQFVQDWQVRTASTPGYCLAAQTAWPTTVQFLIYAAGTFLYGNGMSLDLGVIRDSTLNATNDYTAAWSEECWLVAMLGHESRIVTVPICPNGTVGAATTFACPSC